MAVALPTHARAPQIELRELRQRRQARDITTHARARQIDWLGALPEPDRKSSERNLFV